MPFRLLGHYDPPNRRRALLANSFAISRTCNERNLEFHWYGVWNLHLCTLIKSIPNAFVVPQFPLWVDDNDHKDFVKEEESPEDGGEPEEEHEDPEASAEGPIHSADFLQQGGDYPTSDSEDDDESDSDEADGVADISFTSAASYRAKNAKTRIPDFVVIWTRARRDTSLPPRYANWQITEMEIPAIIEVKRFPSRSLEGELLEEMMRRKFSQAQFVLVDQARHLFAHYPEAESVVAIAAVGPFWRNVTIYSTDQGVMLGTWSVRLKIHSVDSDRRLGTILRRIQRLDTMEVFGEGD